MEKKFDEREIKTFRFDADERNFSVLVSIVAPKMTARKYNPSSL